MDESKSSASRGVFALVDIPAHSTVRSKEVIELVQFSPAAVNVIGKMYDDYYEVAEDLAPVYAYMFGYGYSNNFFGEASAFVDSSFLTFMNHGCNGTSNYGKEEQGDITEWSADPDTFLPHLSFNRRQRGDSIFDPVLDRNFYELVIDGDITTKDIKAGDEILDNYLRMIGTEADWNHDVVMLRKMCSGQGAAEIENYESNMDIYDETPEGESSGDAVEEEEDDDEEEEDGEEDEDEEEEE